MHNGEKPYSDSDFKEVPMDPLAMDTFFTNDRSLWDGNGEDRAARRRFVRKKIAGDGEIPYPEAEGDGKYVLLQR